MPGIDFQITREDGLPMDIFAPKEDGEIGNLPVHSIQAAISRADGTHLAVLIQAALVPGLEIGDTNAVFVFQDISRMRDAEQLKDDFLSLMSHEFRTPLTAIHGGAYLLKQQGEQLDEETRSELLTDIVNESGRLDRMLVNMLSLAATMAGRLSIQTEPVMIGPTVRRIAGEIARRTRSIRMNVVLPSDLPPIECDPEALEQVLRNLYENAIKYGPESGTITTTARIDEGRVTLSVKDDGVGISPEHVTHVFERFRRPGADPTIRGMGLGLYLSRLLVEAQGGTISADSEGPGKGSTFSISLPIVADLGADYAPDSETH
jgi:signal transduction histidine kinase